MYSKTGYSRGIITSLSDALSLPSPQTGETVFCLENNRVLTYDGEIWMCDDFIKMTNNSGSSCIAGDLMEFAQSGSFSAIKTTGGTVRVIGPAIYPAANSAVTAIAFKGIYKVKIVNVVSGPANNIGWKVQASGSGNAGAGISVANVTSGFMGWTVEPVPHNSSNVPGGWGTFRCLLRGKVEYL
jgi:hypothetical protein